MAKESHEQRVAVVSLLCGADVKLTNPVLTELGTGGAPATGTGAHAGIDSKAADKTTGASTTTATTTTTTAAATTTTTATTTAAVAANTTTAHANAAAAAKAKAAASTAGSTVNASTVKASTSNANAGIESEVLMLSSAPSGLSCAAAMSLACDIDGEKTHN